MSFENQYPKENKTYAGQSGYGEPKEYFKLAVEIIKQEKWGQAIQLLDVGCANGAFLFFAQQHLQLTGSVGVDISPDQLNTASRAMPDFRFLEKDILADDAAMNEAFDVVTCLGVISAFDDLKAPLSFILKCVRPGGFALIFDPVNPYNVDVLMRYKYSNENTDSYRPAFNIRGRHSWETTVNKICADAKISFQNFAMPFDIQAGQDPMRAWTFRTETDDRQLMVGTGQLLNFQMIRITPYV